MPRMAALVASGKSVLAGLPHAGAGHVYQPAALTATAIKDLLLRPELPPSYAALFFR
jgi:hypothetical protein